MSVLQILGQLISQLELFYSAARYESFSILLEWNQFHCKEANSAKEIMGFRLCKVLSIYSILARQYRYTMSPRDPWSCTKYFSSFIYNPDACLKEIVPKILIIFENSLQ